jgi:hypothetical protein
LLQSRPFLLIRHIVSCCQGRLPSALSGRSGNTRRLENDVTS